MADGHGGKRRGAGKKKDPLKNIHTATSTALKILKEIEAETKIVEIFHSCGDARLKTHIIFRLREDAYGKPPQSLDLKGEIDANVHIDMERRERVRNLLQQLGLFEPRGPGR